MGGTSVVIPKQQIILVMNTFRNSGGIMRMDPPSASSAATAKGRCDSNDQSAWPPPLQQRAYDAAHERTKFRSPLPLPPLLLPPLPLPALASEAHPEELLLPR